MEKASHFSQNHRQIHWLLNIQTYFPRIVRDRNAGHDIRGLCGGDHLSLGLPVHIEICGESCISKRLQRQPESFRQLERVFGRRNKKKQTPRNDFPFLLGSRRRYRRSHPNRYIMETERSHARTFN